VELKDNNQLLGNTYNISQKEW